MIVAFDETANNVFFISKYFCALIVIKELNLIVIYQISLIITPKCIDSKTKDQIIKKHQLYISKHKICLSNNMQD